MILSNTFIILIVWELFPAVSSQSVGCSFDETEFNQPTWMCHNITMSSRNLKISKLFDTLNSDARVLSFVSANGEFDSSFLTNLTQIKVLSLVESDFKAIKLYSNYLEGLWIVRTTFPNNTTLANCCSRLERLILKSNKGLNLETFGGLRRLRHIDIRFQEIKHITKDTFKNLSRLKTLTLVHCSLESIAEGSFDDLYNLRELYIEDNRISNISMSIFDSLPNLTSLTIYGTNLPPLSLSMFKNQRKLMQIGLPLNTWRVVDVEQIPVMFPRLNFFSHIGMWESDEDEANIKRTVFFRLSKLLANSERYS